MIKTVITKYSCEYCGIIDNHIDIAKHEIKCKMNPENRYCYTCKNKGTIDTFIDMDSATAMICKVGKYINSDADNTCWEGK